MADSVSSSRKDFLPELLSDLARQASFGANIVDAHSCFIFLPATLLTSKGHVTVTDAPQDCELVLAACYSLGPDLVKNARIPSDTGLIGWVARHRHSIHVSPFEQDSRTLGVYLSDQHLKSFIGIPVMLNQTAATAEQSCGVIACDSCKTYAFSKLQGKLLEDLAQEVSNTIRLHLIKRELAGSASSWQEFIVQAVHLSEQLGKKSLEILRLKPRNLENLEVDLGTAECLNLTEQLYTLIRQSLPANFPQSPFRTAIW
jgi:GAF domain-containing protein